MRKSLNDDPIVTIAVIGVGGSAQVRSDGRRDEPDGPDAVVILIVKRMASTTARSIRATRSSPRCRV